MNRFKLQLIFALCALSSAAIAEEDRLISVPLTVRERQVLEQMAAARTMRPDELALALYRDGLKEIPKGVLPPPAPAAVRLTPAEKPAPSVKVNDGAKIAFAGDYFMEHADVPGFFVPQVMRGLAVAGVKNAQKVPAWARGEQTEKLSARLLKLAAGDADWIVFCGGMDDVFGKPPVSPDVSRRNLACVFEAFRASHKNVVVMTLPFRHGKSLQDLDDIVRTEAMKRGLPIVDLAKAFGDAHYLFGYANHESSPVVARLLLAEMGVGEDVARRVADETQQTPGIAPVALRMPSAEAAAAAELKVSPRDVIVARLKPEPIRKDRFAVLCGIDDSRTVGTLRGLTGLAHPKALLFTTASGDDPGQILRITGTFGGQKIRYELVRLCGKREEVDVPALKARILGADIIWFGSGCTERLQEKIALFGLADAFRAAYEKGAVMAGFSAGAIMLCQAGFNDFNDGRYDLMPGLGLVPAYVGPHYQLPKWRAFDARLASETNAVRPSVAWALEDWTLVVYRNGIPEARSLRPDAHAYRFDRQDGKWLK